MLLDLTLLEHDNGFLDMLNFFLEFLLLIEGLVAILAHYVVLTSVHINERPRASRLIRLDKLFDLSLVNRYFKVVKLTDAAIKLIYVELLRPKKVHFLRICLLLQLLLTLFLLLEELSPTTRSQL